MSERAVRVVLGRIGRPHGVKGAVFVDSFTDPPEALFEYSPWRLETSDGGERDYRPVQAQVVDAGRIDRFRVALEGVESREAAAALTGCEVRVDRSALPATAEGEFYLADLLGLEVRNLEGVSLGRVAEFLDAPANPVMVVKPGAADAAAGERWLPVTRQHLRRVDLAAGVVWMDWPADF